MSDGAGDILTCGPTYEKKANTFNSMLLKCKAMFSPNVVEVAYGDLVLPEAAIETFRATKNVVLIRLNVTKHLLQKWLMKLIKK